MTPGSIYQYQPVDPSQSFANTYNLVQGIRQQGAQRNRAELLQEALRGVQENPNPQRIADFYLRFPEMKEQFDAYRETLAEGDKASLQSAAREAIIAQQTGGNPAEVYERFAEAAGNSNRPELAQSFRDAQRTAEMSPEGADLTARMFYQGIDPDGYKALFGSDSATSFQKDFGFIKETFGDDAAAEFAQFGRSGVVSIPLGNGQTFVGPPALAPGASRWEQRGERTSHVTAGNILEGAFKSKSITAAEAQVIQSSLGPKGKAKFNEWRTKNKIRIITRTGTTADGRRVVQYDDGAIEYAK